MRKVLFYALLAAATLGLSEFLAAWRMWRAHPGLGHGTAVIVLGCGVLGVGLWLGFLLYEVDRAAGRVRRPIRPYEWIIARRAAGRAPASAAGASAQRSSRLASGRGRG